MLLTPLCGQSGSPTVASILEKLTGQYNLVKDYSVNLVVSVDMPKMKMPYKRLRLYFKQPDRIKLETRGFAVVPKNGIMGNPTALLDKLTNVHIKGQGLENDILHWVLEGDLNPDSARFSPWENSDGHAFAMKMEIWVDPHKWVIDQSKTYLDDELILLVRSNYLETMKNLFLPEETLIRFEFDENFQGKLDIHNGMKGNRFSGSSSAGERAIKTAYGVIKLKFSDYRLNMGLTDDFFLED
jgi:outer membrane lipoprotein-sorting protein